MKKPVLLSLLMFFSLLADIPSMPSFSTNPKIGVQNLILANVNGTAISVMDLKKKMDVLFHQNYPHLEQSESARYQFYETSWRHVLSEMIDQQLILADAEEKDVKLTEGEIREEMESRFGPNIMITLDKIGLSYPDAWKMVKEDLLVRRMSWWFIHSKALTRVTPQEIRQAFHRYSQEHPSYQEWHYRVIAIRGEKAESLAKEIHSLLQSSHQPFESMISEIAKLDSSIQISSLFSAADRDLSSSHKEVLKTLSSGQYSQPIVQASKTEGKNLVRIFYLEEKIDHPAPDFALLSPGLKSELTQKAIAVESSQYLEKLRKHYGVDSAYLERQVPDHFHPFVLQ